ncbi:MAG: amidohydrolase family protein [Candidatus Aminicenantes bacterium]|nr:amidohydrolase family protein [Candidatus Aminicenantes bacterium]NIN18532.1 amidohydrolase family protein [Candidatus Aminicenantes bacterium]NIN42428.1 amidohydrolase family protein [Candidatus Aminicenantes bacterium]NIN85187.1 amidohydrolase family protein [Candidatus Aminicenantes bacterium]NIO81405.1 amidohydrolase family protein [Candidatus Aminicenantes bacterium]
MKEAGVEKTIIFPLPSVLIDLEKANHYVTAISRKFPDKLIPFTIIDHKPGYWRENGVKGFKEHTFGLRIQKGAGGKNIFSQEFKETYRYMEQHRVPLLLHAGINRVERIHQDLLKDTPGLIIILAHLGADFPGSNNSRPHLRQIISTLEALKGYQNVYFDISGIPDIEIIRAALDMVGSEKLIFGSDFPLEKPFQTLQRLQSIKKILPKELENILYNNIINILNKQQ